jgi:hypothetical protein
VNRVICHFSCGAASAVATKLALSRYPESQVHILNAFIQEEHPDNRRFASDCECWFDRTVTVLRDAKYGASTLEVWRRERYIKGPHGAPCARALKRKLLDAFAQPDDIHVLGYTVQEQDRLANFREASGLHVLAPLVDCNLDKGDCLSIVERAGILLPEMYRMGYDNANCIGCPKGGNGYWNKIRRDFPERFNQIADLQESIGPGAYFLRDRRTGDRISLRQLPSDSGAKTYDEPSFSCSFFCDQVSREVTA